MTAAPPLQPLAFRRAGSTDLPTVDRLLRAVWPDQLPDSTTLAAALDAPEVVTRLAFSAAQPIGLSSCFVTADCRGSLRWELDLLLIDPDAQGRGCSAAVLNDALAGRPAACSLTRALVADGHAARTRMYRRAGFAPATQSLQLWSRRAQQCAPAGAAGPGSGRLIAVTTLLYRGVWLEDVTDVQQLHDAAAAQELAAVATLGVLLPADDASWTPTVQQLGFEAVGTYRWWHHL